MNNFFSIPDSYNNINYNLKLLKLKEEHPEFFYKDFKIDSAYGCPPNCIWNGNRKNTGNMYDSETMLMCLNLYKKYNVSYRLTFTNFLLKEQHLFDTTCNNIASIYEDEKNYVIESTDMMENFIKQNYPKYKHIRSISYFYLNPELSNVDYINNISIDRIVVLPLNLNNNFDELKKLKKPENIEVLINQPCVVNCPYTLEHYTAYNRHNLGFVVEPYQMRCRFLNTDSNLYKERKTYVSNDLIKKYNDVGINHFKIAGRDVLKVLKRTLIDILIQDVYKNIVSNYLECITKYDITLNNALDEFREKSFNEHPKIEIKG